MSRSEFVKGAASASLLALLLSRRARAQRRRRREAAESAPPGEKAVEAAAWAITASAATGSGKGGGDSAAAAAAGNGAAGGSGGGSAGSSRGGLEGLPRELRSEQFARCVAFFGEDGQRAVAGSRVVVVGLGGVGSHVAHMLARSGVSWLRLIDFDQVTLSSLNRHAVAGLADVGRPKAEVLASHLSRIVPDATIDARVQMFEDAVAEELLLCEDGSAPDFVLDCIDDARTKVQLLLFCHARGLRVLSSLGAGARADPTRLLIGDLSEVRYDRLAAKIRRMLKEEGVWEGIPVVYSCEKVTRKLLPLTKEQAAAPDEFGTVPGMRLRVLPVLGPLPALFGQAMASYVLCTLAGQPFEPAGQMALTRDLLNKMLNRLATSERKRGVTSPLKMTHEELGCLLVDGYRLCCAASGVRLGSHGVKMQLLRWDATQPAALDNIVLLTKKEADVHLRRESLDDVPPIMMRRVARAMKMARDMLQHVLPEGGEWD